MNAKSENPLNCDLSKLKELEIGIILCECFSVRVESGPGDEQP